MKKEIVVFLIMTLLIAPVFSLNALGDENLPPNQPTDPKPENQATNVAFYDFENDKYIINLSWSCSDPNENDTLMYDIYFGDISSPPLVKSNHPKTWFNLTNEVLLEEMRADTKYYWKIIVHDNQGGSNSSELWNFTTKDYAPQMNGFTYEPKNPEPGEPITFDASECFGIGEDIEFKWIWNFYKNYEFEYCGNNPIVYHTYDQPLTNVRVMLVISDDDGNEERWMRLIQKVWPSDEVAPLTPSAPEGETSGNVDEGYIFTAVTTDDNGDDIFYMFDWGDGTFSDWKGPVPSGETIEVSHTWLEKGNYNVRVKAFDSFYHQGSEWSEPHEIAIPHNNQKMDSPFNLFERIVERFLQSEVWLRYFIN